MEAALLELLLRQVPRCFVLVGLALPVREQMAYGMPSCVASKVHAGGDASSWHKLGLDAQSSSLLPFELLGVSLHPLDLVLEGLDGIILFQKAACESKRILGAHLVKVGDHRALLVNVGAQLLLLRLWSCVGWSSGEATGRWLLLRCSSEEAASSAEQGRLLRLCLLWLAWLAKQPTWPWLGASSSKETSCGLTCTRAVWSVLSSPKEPTRLTLGGSSAEEASARCWLC